MSSARPVHLAITTGEPAGIGPEIAIAALDAVPPGVQCSLIGNRQLLEQIASTALPSNCAVVDVSLATPVTAGTLDPRNAAYVLQMLDHAIAGALSGRFDAVVTAPLHKGVINDAGVPFTGHTEYLAAKAGVAAVVMLLVGGGLRVALATTHLPLAQVPAAITLTGLGQCLDVLNSDLQRKFGLPTPRIAVAGLNPHAGEGGHLGREEITVIAPAVQAARARGINAIGPLAADTLFVPKNAQQYDAILAMYHDQGLAPLKYASFGHGVNVTLGLPFVRTSVDHGTALDLAGQQQADANSMRAAIRLAAQLVRP